MDKNTYSLLSSNWMFSGETSNILMPFLLNIVNGSENKASLKSTAFLQYGQNGLKSFDATHSTSEKRVAIISMHHPIFKYDHECGPKGTQTVIQMLEQWRNDESILGVVCDYNSGGGQASGNEEAADYIFNYPKPVVSYSNDLVGSAAFYLYAAGKYRILNQYADFVGCIGSMYYSVNLKGVLERNGAKVNEVYSSLSPEKNKQSRALDNGDSEPLINKVLNPLASKFHTSMKKFLPNITEKALLGDIFSPEEAMNEGLIDSFGTLQDAIDKVIELSNTSLNTNLNFNYMSTKSYPRLEKALGLEAPLESNDNGSYINEEQKQTLETRLDSLESEKANLEEQLATSNASKENAVHAITAQLTEVKNNAQTVESSVDAILTKAGMSTEGTLAEKLSALETKAEAYGKGDGAKGTTPRIDANGEQNSSMIIGGVDVSEALNN